MRPFPLTTLTGGINRLQVKGNASASNLYDLVNAYITNEGTVSPREGTVRAATLDTNTVGLMYFDGVPNIFGATFTTSTATVPSGYKLNVLLNPVNAAAIPTKIWFAKPFMGFPFVTAEFTDGSVYDYWLQNSGTWTSDTVYTSASIVLPVTPNGLAYQGVRNWPPNPFWSANTLITSGSYVEPNEATGYCYRAIAVAGTSPHTGASEPVWPTVSAGQIQEFGDFDTSSSDAGTTQASSTTTQAAALSSQITDRYGDSFDIAGSGTPATTNITITTASTKVTTWKAGTLYAPGAVVIPTNTQGAFVNAIPNGDFENGNDGSWTFSGTTDWEYSTTDPYQGDYWLEYPGGSGTAADGDFATMTTGAPVTPGQSVTVTGILDPNNSGANLELWLVINWYDASNTYISRVLSAAQEGGGSRSVSVTGSAPAGAAFVKAAIRAGSGTTSRNPGYADLISWNLETPTAVSNFLYEAVQSAPGSSGTSQPTWPTIESDTVQDGTVTWEAIGTSIITWEAVPLMLSGNTQPTWPTVNSGTVFDASTFKDANGAVTSSCGFTWQCTSRVITDVNDPQTIPTALGASHVFKGNLDIVSFSAAVNPIDFTSPSNAGYLPTGLNNYGDNPVAMLALYRSNLMVFNAGGYQMWQIDPDPLNMAILDAQPVGSTWPRAAQSVANDLLFLTEVGVRNLSTIGATANMAIGNTGQPVDPLIKAQLNNTSAIPGDPDFSEVAILLSETVEDTSSYNLPLITSGVVVSTIDPPGDYSSNLLFEGPNPSITIPAFPLNQVTGGDWTMEFWINPSMTTADESGILQNATITTANMGLYWNKTAQGLTGQVFGNSATSSTEAIPAGQWSFVSWSVCSSEAYLYVNGILQPGYPEFTEAGQPAPTGSLIMGNNLSHDLPFNGGIAGFRITENTCRYCCGSTLTTAQINSFQTPFLTTSMAYDPLSLYYPGRGQYWLIFGPQAFVLTVNGMEQAKKTWSRYLFPDSITDWSLSTGNLYMRTAGNLVWQLTDQSIGVDDNNTITTAATPTAFNGVMQWPYLNAGQLGINKMMIGIDIVGTGSCSIQVGFNQADTSSFNDQPTFSTSTSVTTPYFVAIDDTVPEEPLPFPINAPSYSVILTFAGSTSTANAWGWEACNLYLADQSGGGATG